MNVLTSKKAVALATINRNTTIDLIRIFAAFGVITIHVRFNTAEAKSFQDLFTLFCVPFFYLISLTYFVSGLKGTSVYDTLKKTLSKLVLPYLAWSAVYVGLLIVKSLLMGVDKEFVFWRVLFYGESAVHLYFLPELLNMQVMALGVFLLFTSNNKKRALGFLFLLISIFYIKWGYLNNCFGVTNPISIFAYILSAFVFSSRIKYPSVNWIYLIAGISLVIITVTFNWFKISYGTQGIPIGGIGLLLIAISFPSINLPGWLLQLSTTTFGIYLSHVIFLEAFEFILERVYSGTIYYDLKLKILVTSIIFMLSYFFTFFLRKILVLRQMLLGEKQWSK